MLHIQITLLRYKISLKLTLSNFWIKCKKGISKLKKKGNYHRILHIQINQDSKFQLQQTILIFGTNFQKKCILLVKNRNKMNITIEFFIIELV